MAALHRWAAKLLWRPGVVPDRMIRCHVDAMVIFQQSKLYESPTNSPYGSSDQL